MPLEPKPAAVEVTGNIRINVDGTDFSLMRIRQIVDAGTQLLFSQKRHRSTPDTRKVSRVLSRRFGLSTETLLKLLILNNTIETRDATALRTGLLNALSIARESKLSVVQELAA
jgi:hypothetical protein